MKKDNKITGDLGENLALEYLLENSCVLLEKNFTTSIGEIDLIVKDKEIVVFVEVKTRKNKDFGTPESFVNPKKIQLLVKATQAYIEKKDLDVEVRFDIIAITMQPNLIIEHIENAYYHF